MFVDRLQENKEKEDCLLGEKRFIDERVTELENSIKVIFLLDASSAAVF